ncbi:unnamed protein product, partial [Tuber aestivum]
MAAEDILQKFLPVGAVDSAPVRTLLTEILAGAVLKKIAEKCPSAGFV